MMKKTKTTVVFTHVGPSEEFRYALHRAICSRGHASMDELHAVTEQIETPKLTARDIFNAGKAWLMLCEGDVDGGLAEIMPVCDLATGLWDNTAFEGFFALLERRVDFRGVDETKANRSTFDFASALHTWLVDEQGVDLT